MSDILTILIQATALMLALIALRPLLKRFVSPGARCALWALPALRLLFPFRIPSPVSIMTPIEPVSSELSAAVSRPLEAPSWLGSGIGLESSELPAVDAAPDALIGAPQSGISLSNFLLLIWLVGAVVVGSIIVYQNLRFHKTSLRCAEKLGDGWGLPVYLLKTLPSPCLAGVIRPKIYINARTLVSDEVLEMTILHETTHYKRLDHIWGAVRGLMLTLFWFHPLVWLCSELFRADCETACDAAATRGMDHDKRMSYGLALISLASRIPAGSAGRLVCLSTMSSNKRLLKERIRTLAKGKTFRSAALIALMLAAVLCFTMCTVPTGDEDSVSPPATTPQALAKQNAVPDTENSVAAPEQSAPQQESGFSSDTVEDLAYFMELAALGQDFDDMDVAKRDGILTEYGELLDNYELISRESSDGSFAYIVGRYMGGDSNNELLDMWNFEMGAPDGWAQILYTEAQSDAVEQALALSELPEADVFQITKSRIHYSRDNELIFIEPVGAVSLNTVYSRYCYTPNGREYIADAASRGVSLTEMKGAYLEVYYISETYGEVSERIALSDAEYESIKAESLDRLSPGYGFSATLKNGDESVYFSEYKGVPSTVLKLAVEKCDYKFATPEDITKLKAATFECSWLNEAITLDGEKLERLEEILKNAEFGYVGSCGYGAKLTLEMDNGEKIVVFKGSDCCDSIVFGSYGGYFLGDEENIEFWSLFGLDTDFTHNPL